MTEFADNTSMYNALFPFDHTNLQSLVLRLLQNLIAVKAKERFRSILPSYVIPVLSTKSTAKESKLTYLPPDPIELIYRQGADP